MDTIESYNRVKKQKIADMFMHATVIADRIGGQFSKKSSDDVLHPWHFYPETFSDERTRYEAAEAERETYLIKAQMDARIAALNKKFGKGQNNGS